MTDEKRESISTWWLANDKPALPSAVSRSGLFHQIQIAALHLSRERLIFKDVFRFAIQALGDLFGNCRIPLPPGGARLIHQVLACSFLKKGRPVTASPVDFSQQ
jgi:hypothetical protein